LEDELNAANRLLAVYWRNAERAEVARLRLQNCPTHGQQPPNAWGCPECVRELRAELAEARQEAKNLRAELALMYGEPPGPEEYY
jgi:hypothetical protein